MRFSDVTSMRLNVRRASVASYDVAAWFVATLGLAGARYDFALNRVQWESSLHYALWASLLTVALGYSSGLYRGHYRVGSFQEAARLATAVVTVTLIIGIGFIFLVPDFPRGLALSVPPGALLFMAMSRSLDTTLSSVTSSPSIHPPRSRVRAQSTSGP